MTESTQLQRDQVRATANDTGDMTMAAVVRDADRAAAYERDLHDDAGKDRSQDADWLRAGFLRRGAEIERLEELAAVLAQRLQHPLTLDDS